MSWNRRRFLDTSLRSSTLVALGGPTIPDFSVVRRRPRARPSRMTGFSWSFSSWVVTTV